MNTFKYDVPCTDGKISVRIILISYFSTVKLTSCVLLLTFYELNKMY